MEERGFPVPPQAPGPGDTPQAGRGIVWSGSEQPARSARPGPVVCGQPAGHAPVTALGHQGHCPGDCTERGRLRPSESEGSFHLAPRGP